LYKPNDEVVVSAGHLRGHQELGVHQRIQLVEMVLGVDASHLVVGYLQLIDQNHTNALFDGVTRAASGEDQQIILINSSTLDTEVLDLDIIIEGPLPLRLASALSGHLALIHGDFKLEAVLVEVNEREEG